MVLNIGTPIYFALYLILEWLNWQLQLNHCVQHKRVLKFNDTIVWKEIDNCFEYIHNCMIRNNVHPVVYIICVSEHICYSLNICSIKCA